MSERFDAIVIGGGPAGATTALLLARAGWTVAVIEGKAFPRRKVCGEYLSATNLSLLEDLGVGAVFRDQAGPPVRQVGLFAGETIVTTELPRPRGVEWGRALSREHLDTLLLEQARQAGAHVLQPWSAKALSPGESGFRCDARCANTGATTTLLGTIVVAAHGSWDPGSLPTQGSRPASQPGDLLGFKAHFSGSTLAEGLMPLLAFPGGYGGMVHTDGSRVSLSCCVRRDCLTSLRDGHDEDAGDVVLDQIQRSCRGTREALLGARREGPWLAAGPIRPGIRLHESPGIFPVGNLAGEAHPVVAEGISMALQGAWLLVRALDQWRRAGKPPEARARVHRDYAIAWRRCFAARVHAAAAIAQWAMRPYAVSGTLPLLRRWPQLLHWGARLSGKDRAIGIRSQEPGVRSQDSVSGSQ